MKNLKAVSVLGLLALMIISGCSENDLSPVSASKSISADKVINDSREPSLTQEITLKPGDSKSYDNTNLPMKTLNSFEITNLTNYGNLTCSDISINYFYGGPNVLSACLAHMESLTEGYIPGTESMSVTNDSEKIIKLKIYIK